jgi:hypothetical protein
MGATGLEEPWAAALLEGHRLVVFPLPHAMPDLNDPCDQLPGTGLLVMPRGAHPDGRANSLHLRGCAISVIPTRDVSSHACGTTHRARAALQVR